MKNEFKEVKPGVIKDNTFKLIGKDWMLVTAGKIDKYNMMTASWGALGVLWNKNVCFCFIRPTRHTYTFMESNDYFTICLFDEKYRDILNFCGSKSGKDINKMTATKLAAVKSDLGNVYFSEARIVIECKKIYFQDLNPKHFLDPKIDSNYPNKDYHRMYVGEIVKCLIR
ncbi:MAG: flavin reductase [Elusimicrobia bacterium]|nr:flavin reductase [Elusimicrobiota bacterium]MBU2614183.1 flavin reductase [Elusimicrobiota bacterium]